MLAVWYDGYDTDGNGLPDRHTNGTPIATWTDKSANTNHATQSTASYTPAYATNAASVLGGLPVLRFRGNDDRLNVARQFKAYQVYCVYRSPNANFNNYGSVFGAQTSTRTFIFQNGGTYLHANQYPRAMKKNGTSVTIPSGEMSPITDYMILTVNVKNETTLRSYYVGRQDDYSCDLDGRQGEVGLGVVVTVAKGIILDRGVQFVRQVLDVTLNGLGAYFPFLGQAGAVGIGLFPNLAVDKQQSAILGFEFRHTAPSARHTRLRRKSPQENTDNSLGHYLSYPL